jgi:hypothetical protein
MEEALEERELVDDKIDRHQPFPKREGLRDAGGPGLAGGESAMSFSFSSRDSIDNANSMH